MIPLDSLLTFIVASTLLSLAPGPDNIFVLTQSALFGRKSGVLITFGLCTGLVAHTSAVALGVAVILQTSPLAFNLLKFAGAAYLAYLAWLSFRASAGNLAGGVRVRLSDWALYRRGIIMNITNPKVTIFFLAFLPQFVSAENGSAALQIFLLGGVFIVVALIVFCSIAILAGRLGNWLSQSPRAQVYLNRIAGVVFAVLALNLVTASL